MPPEKYPCYVKIIGHESETVELPTEKNGALLLSTIKAQFPNAIGLRFKSSSGAWRGLNVSNDVLFPPLDGWKNEEYFISTGATKRKAVDNKGPINKKALTDSDLIVLGLPYSTTELEMKSYFEQFGELQNLELKVDIDTGKSKGFGFIRYKKNESVVAVLAVPHIIGERRCEVRFPKGESMDTPTKLFVGRLPKETTADELTSYFSEYGTLTDVFIPKEFRGFGFITFGSVDAARQCLAATHVFKRIYLNVSHPSPKDRNKRGDSTKASNLYLNSY